MSLRLVGVLATTLFLTACGGSNSAPTAPSNTPAPEGSTTVTIAAGASARTSDAYGANPLTVSSGTTISWLNDDSITHTSTADGGQWSSGNLAPGARFNFTFSTPGQYAYHCQIHPNMVGTIVVQ